MQRCVPLNIRTFDGKNWVLPTTEIVVDTADTKKAPPAVASPSPSSSTTTLRIASFNVLADTFPWFVEWAINSPKRFKALPNAVAAIKADLLGLNEVTQSSLDALKNDAAIRAGGYSIMYYDDSSSSSSSSSSSTQKNYVRTHGCALFSKLPVIEAVRVELDAQCHPIVAVMRGGGCGGGDDQRLIAVVAIHTSAYATAENRAVRTRQLAAAKQHAEGMLARIRRSSRRLAAAAADEDNDDDVVVVMGDLNLHDINEDKNVLDLKMLDAFAETNWTPSSSSSSSSSSPAAPTTSVAAVSSSSSSSESALASEAMKLMKAKPGYTFEPVSNRMIPRYIPGETRKMRLDRILVRPGCHAQFVPGSGQIWADASVGSELFLSDHYGLVAELVLFNDKQQKQQQRLRGCPYVKKLLEQNAQLPNDRTGVSSTAMELLKKVIAFTLHVPFLAKRGAGL